MNPIRFICTVQESIKAFGGSPPPPAQPAAPAPLPAAPASPAATPADTAAQTSAAQDAAFAQQNAGKASTILTSSQGTGPSPSASQQLLGN